jgi:hypothetical protein
MQATAPKPKKKRERADQEQGSHFVFRRSLAHDAEDEKQARLKGEVLCDVLGCAHFFFSPFLKRRLDAASGC